MVRRSHCSATDQGSAFGEECFDHSRRFDRPCQHEQMPVVDHLEPGIRDEPRENAAVDLAHQRREDALKDENRHFAAP
jgi:hypothetical protein